MPQTIFPPAGIYAIDVTLPVDTRRDFTSQTINNTNTADNVLETDHFTDNYFLSFVQFLILVVRCLIIVIYRAQNCVFYVIVPESVE